MIERGENVFALARSWRVGERTGGAGRSAVERGVVGSGRRERCGRRAVRALRPPLLQRLQPAPTRAAHSRGPAGGLRAVRPLLQDAALPAPAHACPTSAKDQTAAAAPPSPRAPLT
ncbi:unnamed protein product [Pieris brassicae]|uniref:Uncharacterized protein n=1 Tax=Pieris brassicae TaxID=7116 RepID=A0A9P0XJZ5_PIEBR|nr:unnamed protein product [Pieris brassicae]